MNKPVFGLLLGSILGAFDGLSALVSAPETAPQIGSIVIGSTLKGLIAGILIGWFAHKVHSLIWGIVFGLSVGLALAYLVVYMQVQGGGPAYYWEIMLPGSLVGLIVGYATQRFGGGRQEGGRSAAGVLLLTLLLAGGGAAGAESGVTGAAAFARLKGLVGDWRSTTTEAAVPGGQVRYRLTGAGSALVETLFPGSDHEMVTIYYLEGEDLVATHYCAAGNQPHFRLDRRASTPDKLVFAFDGGSNIGENTPHIHDGWIRFVGDDRVEASWTFYRDGKAAESNRFLLERPKS